MPRDFPGDASQQVTIEPREPFRAHHNQIGTMALRGTEDCFSRSPIREDVIDGEPSPREPPPHPLQHEQGPAFALTHRPLDSLRQVDPPHAADASQLTVRILFDMQEHDA